MKLTRSLRVAQKIGRVILPPAEHKLHAGKRKPSILDSYLHIVFIVLQSLKKMSENWRNGSRKRNAFYGNPSSSTKCGLEQPSMQKWKKFR